jgi:hypothetical protein
MEAFLANKLDAGLDDQTAISTNNPSKLHIEDKTAALKYFRLKQGDWTENGGQVGGVE